ncbi:9265_t:CDS:10 [Diversispora eburnea]|uniref:9265_t:CDS:1 n=1 Tax=Diversispora eburnea TaxID=1213867 RepID=A0A9N8VBX6_9GLOM|nr:9265_t:CDS:10 [Diversispora eburnea]
MQAERRKEELQKKRQKLEELRRAREERKTPPSTEQPKPSKAPPTETPAQSNRQDELKALLADLLDPKPASKEPETPAPAVPEEAASTETPSLDSPPSADTAGPPSAPAIQSSLSSEAHSSAALGGARFIPQFVTFGEIILDIPPKEIVYYTKETQTLDTSFVPPPPSEEEIREKVKKEFDDEIKAREAAAEEQRLKREAEKKKEAKLNELSDQEKKGIVISPEFNDFIKYSSKIVERALNENYDLMRDYTIDDETENEINDGPCVKFLCSYFDERWSKNRFVTDNPELSVASYNKNPYNMNDPDGIVLVWNLRLIERPEFVFHSQSDVLTTMFSAFHQNLIIGGTYSGQVLLWDMRAKSLPVLKTPLSCNGHTHPIYSMQMVGTQNAHNLITASTDGLLCSWQLDMLLQPTETLELVHSEHTKTDEVSVTSFSFPENETSAFWVGTEEGNIYQANRFGHAGGKAGINPYDFYKGHWGPVTGLHFHPLMGPIDFSDLFLTSSVDWTIKLWKAKSIAKPSSSAQIISSIYSFEATDDYVYDVKWSPSNPAMFGSVDGKANFSVWNLNDDPEIPIVNTQVGTGRALNKLQWDKDGKRAAIGASDGRVHVYDLSIPRDDEWVRMQKTIAEMMDGGELLGKYRLYKV